MVAAARCRRLCRRVSRRVAEDPAPRSAATSSCPASGSHENTDAAMSRGGTGVFVGFP